jgi:tRNA A58 N-methylase Trm61
MLQPFEDFKPAYISRLLQLGRRWLVSQTYRRVQEGSGDPADRRVNLLFSDYVELGEAKLHVNAVKKDSYAAIIDLKNPVHLKKIQEMLMAGSRYRIYFAVVRSAKELENLVNKRYKDKLKQYVDKQTNWRISHDAIVKPTIQLSFGELYIILKHGSQHIRIKFEDIEQ